MVPSTRELNVPARTDSLGPSVSNSYTKTRHSIKIWIMGGRKYLLFFFFFSFSVWQQQIMVVTKIWPSLIILKLTANLLSWKDYRQSITIIQHVHEWQNLTLMGPVFSQELQTFWESPQKTLRVADFQAVCMKNA